MQRYCPDGVEYRSLLSVADVLYGFPCSASAFNDTGSGLPLARIRNVLTGITETFTTEIIPEQYMLNKGDLLVGMDGNFHVGQWHMTKGVLCQRVCKFSSKDESIFINSFLKHLLPPIMLSIELSKQSGTVKHLLDKDVKAIEVPIPPLPVQQEIVRILDTFTESAAELTAKLTVELTARKELYEHYRDELFSFKRKENA